MKKVIILFALVSLMVFTLSFSALGASQVYFDYIVDGEAGDADFSGFVLGGEYKADSFKVGLDYLIGEIDDIADNTQIILKGGYGVTKNVFVTLSMFDGSAEGSGYEMSVNGVLLGADLSYDFSKQFTFEGSFGISVNGEFEFNSISEDADITIVKLKLIYNVSDNIGVAFGYNDISIEFGDNDSDLNYLTLGAAYKF